MSTEIGQTIIKKRFSEIAFMAPDPRTKYNGTRIIVLSEGPLMFGGQTYRVRMFDGRETLVAASAIVEIIEVNKPSASS